MRTLGLVHAIHLQPPAHPPNTQYRGSSVNYTDETMNYLTSTASRPPGCCGSFPHHPCPHEFSGLLPPAVFPSSSPSLSPVLRTITRVPISFPFISLSSHLGFIPYPPTQCCQPCLRMCLIITCPAPPHSIHVTGTFITAHNYSPRLFCNVYNGCAS